MPFGIRLIWVRSSTIVALTNILTLIQKSLDTCLLWKKRLLGYTFYITRFQHFILIHSTKSQHILIRLSNLWIKDKINAQSCIHILTIILPKISKFTVTGSTGTRCSLSNRYFNRLINQNKKLFPYYRLMTQRHLDDARRSEATQNNKPLKIRKEGSAESKHYLSNSIGQHYFLCPRQMLRNNCASSSNWIIPYDQLYSFASP